MKKFVPVEDLEPILLDKVSYDGLRLKFKRPHYVTPQYLSTEEEGFYTVFIPDFNIELCEPTLDKLKAAINEQVAYLWREFVCEDETHLTDKALLFRKSVIDAIEED